MKMVFFSSHDDVKTSQIIDSYTYMTKVRSGNKRKKFRVLKLGDQVAFNEYRVYSHIA